MATTQATTAPPTSDPSVVSRLAAKRDKWKGEADRLRQEHAAASTELDRLRKELADLKESGGGRVKELQTELRTLRHRRVFDRLAEERGVDTTGLDDLFTLSGYGAEADEPDEEAIAKLLDEAAEHPSRSRFFAARDEAATGGDGRVREPDPAAGRTETIIPGRTGPAVDAGRGARHKGDGTVFLTREQLADPKFMLDPKNAATKKGAKVRI